MKIAIICGSLQPGHDGVGDYTRRLAGEIIKQGHEVTAIALNDRHIQSTIEEIQDADGVDLKVMRIASVIEDQERFTILKGYLLNFKPNWVSLQFVPYSFHIKGIPFQLFGQLAALKLQVKWHILFHEIWLDEVENINQHIVKLLQKYVIYKGIKKLNPCVVNVTIPYNKYRLNTIGVQSSVIGLFGNITKSNEIEKPEELNDADYNILYFGGPPRIEFCKQIIAGLHQFCKKESGPTNVIIVSGNSAKKDFFVSALKNELSVYGTQIKDLGFLEEDYISSLLIHCTVGIGRATPYFIGKSGSAVAMLEHGLPVWLPKWVNKEPVDYEFRRNLIFDNLEQASFQSHNLYYSLLTDVAQLFIEQLTKH